MKSIYTSKLFIIGIVLSSLLSIPFLLDYTLVPRFVALATCIALTLFYLFYVEILFVKEITKQFKLNIIFISYGCYVLFCCASVFYAITKSEAIFESSKQVLFFFVFVLSYLLLKNNHDYFFKTILKFSIILFVILFVVFIYQICAIQNFDKVSFYLVTGLNGHKNLFASFLFLNLFFLIHAYFHLNKLLKTAAIICICINLLILFLLQTKAVWLGIFIVTLVSAFLFIYIFYFKTFKLKINFFVFLITALLVSNIFFIKFLQPILHKSIHFTSQVNASKSTLNNSVKLEEERLILWDKTYHLINQKPWFGVGMGNWQIHLPDATLSGLIRGEDLNYTFQRPHNDFLWILSEIGIIGFNLFLIFLFSILFFLLKSLLTIKEDKTLAQDIIFCIAFIIGYFTISFFDFPRERIEHGVWINIIFGMALYHITSLLSLKNYSIIRFSLKLIFLVFTVLLFTIYIGLMRLNGEFFTRKMYDYRNSNDLLNVIRAGNAAQSFLYTLDPTSIPLYWYTGNAKSSIGNYKEAQIDFLKAKTLNPFNRNVLNDLGSSYVFNKDVISAKKYYEESARISPRFDEPKLNLAAMYINANDFKTASFWLNSLFHDSKRRSAYQKIVDLNK